LVSNKFVGLEYLYRPSFFVSLLKKQHGWLLQSKRRGDHGINTEWLKEKNQVERFYSRFYQFKIRRKNQ